MLKIKKISISLFVLFLVFAPAVIFSAEAENTGIVYDCVDGNVYGNCTFQDFIRAIEKVINKGTQFALFFSVVVIAYAGYNYLISGDKPGKRAEANKMFVSVFWGLFWLLGSWLVINLITTNLLGKNFGEIFTK